MIITIDGPAGSGKSTVAKIISNKMNLIHFDSGAIFRGVTAYLIDSGYNISSITKDSDIPAIVIDMNIINNVVNIRINNLDVTPRLRDIDVSNNVAKVAVNKNIRLSIDEFQRSFAIGKNIIVDGRDTGSHVYPNADYKFYLDCDVRVRANRRYKEEQSKNISVDYESILEEIKKRDHLDKTREIAPLIVPDNATVIDTSNLTIDQVVEVITSKIYTNN
ncbi:MAG: (d)CMP kinase [Clostridia bacterium]|nr:(d)CMP kinase [Clostridia bacterium]